MGEDIFRKKSLERIQSPEGLYDYVRVSGPGVWLVLLGACLLLAGACIWGFFGRIESSVSTVVTAESGKVVCIVAAEDFTALEPGMKIRFDRFTGEISTVTVQGGGERYLCEVKTDTAPDDGIFSGRIITKTVSPLSFVLN